MRAILQFVLSGMLLAAGGSVQSSSLPAPLPVPLNDHTYWFGNSFHGGHREKGKWMPLDIDDIFIFPDGRIVANCDWDEGGRAIGFYKDGEVVGKMQDYTALTGGIGVTADEQFIFALRTERKLGESDPMWHGVARYTLEGKPATWPGAEGRVRNVLFLHPPSKDGGRPLTGVAARNGELFLSDPLNRTIKVYATLQMTPKRQFNLAPETDVPGKMVFDKSGRLWIAQCAPANSNTIPKLTGTWRLRAYDPLSGVYAGLEILDCGEPAGLAVRANGELLVADNGPRQRCAFTNSPKRLNCLAPWVSSAAFTPGLSRAR